MTKHTPTPLSVGPLVRETFGNFLPLIYDEKMIAALIPVPYLSDPKYQERAAHIVRCVNLFDFLIEALEKAKIDHYICEDDPHFSCHASQSSIDYYDDPQIKWKPEPICDCGADKHNSAIDAVLSKAKGDL